MEKFLQLPEEKQAVIRNAALEVFGSMGYKKASIRDIAAQAGISKPMVFHYFGSKKALYLYLIDYCSALIVDEIRPQIDSKRPDFFERLIRTTDTKIAVLKRSSHMLRFLGSMRGESDPEVADEVRLVSARESSFHILLDDADGEKFKEGVDMELVLRMLRWMAAGYINEMPGRSAEDMDKAAADFYRILELLRSNLYREEWR